MPMEGCVDRSRQIRSVGPRAPSIWREPGPNRDVTCARSPMRRSSTRRPGTRLVVHAEEDDDGRRAGVLHLTRGLKAVEAGHGDVEDEDVGMQLVCGTYCIIAGADGSNNREVFGQESRDSIQDRLMIVSDEDSDLPRITRCSDLDRRVDISRGSHEERVSHSSPVRRACRPRKTTSALLSRALPALTHTDQFRRDAP